MENQKPVVYSENKDLTTYMWEKMREMAEQPKGISENIDMTLQKAFSNVCKSKTPIKTLKDFSQIKGVGKWIVRLMQGFFETQSGTSESSEGGLDEIEGLTKKGKKIKGRYVPKKGSVAYTLLLTLYRGTVNGNDFMRKQDIIDAAEASGLSRVPIAPEKGKVKPGSFGTSPKDWYSGWSCMATLITKGLVVKSSCPAKYMLTKEGQEAARECLLRSGLVDSGDELAAIEGGSNLYEHNTSDLEFVRVNSAEEVASHSVLLSNQKKNVDIPLKSIERNMPEYQDIRVDCLASSNTCLFTTDRLRENSRKDAYGGSNMPKKSYTADSAQSSFTLRACSFDDPVKKSGSDGLEANMKSLSMPPLSFGENFEDAYDVILILDDREKFAMQGSRSRKIIENIRSQFKIRIEVGRLPVGDGIWIARDKHLDSEYVLDFIVERKKVDDLRCSIRDNRYRDPKLRLVRCGLKKLIYLVEGDLNSSEAADSIKTACFTTEILEGFDVQRTSGLGDTLRKYGYLTQGITHYYRSQLPDDKVKSTGVCPTFVEFIKRCQDLDKMTVGDVFAIQLMQVTQVTEEIAIAILDMYPTLFSLARAYTLLDGDVCAQEEMLQKQSNNVVGASASRNIFQLVWGN